MSRKEVLSWDFTEKKNNKYIQLISKELSTWTLEEKITVPMLIIGVIAFIVYLISMCSF